MKEFGYEITNVGREDVPNLIGCKIVAFQIAEPGAMGRHGGVFFVTEEKKAYYTCYLEPSDYAGYDANMTYEELEQVFPPLKEFETGILGRTGNIPTGWKHKYLGFGNHLLVKEEYYESFTSAARKLNEDNPDKILYNLWLPAIMKCLK